MSVKPQSIRFQNGLAGLLAGDDGPAVILLHPIGLASQTWRHVQPGLADGCRTLALDLLGFGASAKPAGADYSLQAHAERVLEAAAELRWERVTFVGNSLGGGVSLAAAIAAPNRVASLTLIGTLAFPAGLPPLRHLPRVPFAELMVRHTGRHAARWVIGYCFADRRRVERRAVRSYADVLASRTGYHAFRRTMEAFYAGSLAELVPYYPTLRCPTGILHGDRDPVIPRWVPERLATELPNAELRWLRRVGHFPQEEDPEQLLYHLVPFVGAVRDAAYRRTARPQSSHEQSPRSPV